MGRTFDVVDPATEDVVGQADDHDVVALGPVLDSARAAFDDGDWPHDLAMRVAGLRQLHEALVRHGDRLRDLTTAEGGSPTSLTTGPQYDLPVSGLAWMADLAERYDRWTEDLGAATPMGIPTRRSLRRVPAGVVGAITPWNYPTQIGLAKLGPALAAGCTVVWKPAPDTPLVAAEIGRLVAEETDIPDGVVSVVTSSGHEVGAALSSDPRVDLVSFTGSTATGRAVMAAAAPTLKRVFLELGGKSASIVLEDADLGAAAGMAAYSTCIHAGQGCALTTRLVVPRDLLDEAVAIAAGTMSSIGVGDPRDPGTVCGPVISASQRDRVVGFLDGARSAGATFACGGGTPPDRGRGWWIEPTVVTGVDNGARIAREEVFGPVLVVLAHDGEDDAVRIANDSPYGLSGAVWSADVDRAHRVAARVRTGTMSVNGGVWFSPDVPFGGMKQSGIGREMGVAGLEEYLEVMAIAEPS